MKRLKIICCVSLLFTLKAVSQTFVSEKKQAGSFSIVSGNNSTAIYTDIQDHWLIQKASSLLADDIERVTGRKPAIIHTLPSASTNIIIVGSLDKSTIIKQLVQHKKLNPDNIKGKWEGYQLQVLSNPIKGIENALVITGNDRRGTAYGVFELSEQIGVSPWYWWADVPVKKKSELYVNKGTLKHDAPAVKYRGIFINDEAPAFSGWTKEKFGGVNHNVYEKMFELLLRMKANYLWPAMWANAFNDDDTLNPIMADKYGIVMGTSHHEPMLRAQQEWKRYGKGAWDYTKNDTVLRAFWRKGIENMGTHESIVSIGMRGDGDMPMTQGTATDLLEKIVKDQRQIIKEVTGKDPSATPQLWALYKEVQDYYDKGMRVPDDVTLLLCDDNWGNIRKLPKLEDKKHPGGYGIYYHFDYVGGPRNYKWLNTNQIEKTWEQMHLAYEYGVDRIWIVNVGDLKPMEFPINFFLDYAWKPGNWTADKLPAYYIQWARKQFGSKYAKDIADILAKYTKYNARRKPELLDQNTYSIVNYNEAETVVNEYNDLLAKAEKINTALPAEYKDAYFQLVLHPVRACANLNELYVTVAKNRALAAKRSANANEFADRAKELYKKDSLISVQYHTIAGGKWNHMMDQTHIGYTYWQQPPRNTMPAVRYVPADSAVKEPSATNISTDSRVIANEIIGTHPGEILLHRNIASARSVVPAAAKGNVFYEQDGYVSMQADHYTKAVSTPEVKWQVIPNLGNTGSAITPLPVTASIQTPSGNAPHLEYEMYLLNTDSFKVKAYFSPTLNFHNDEGLKYAVSVDNEEPQIITLNKDDNNNRTWEGWVANNVIQKTTSHKVKGSGKHVLKYWMVNPGVVLEKIVVDKGGVKQSYLGPPETARK